MLPEYSRTKSESLAQISTPMAEIQKFFQGIIFYWHTLYMLYSHLCNKYSENRTDGVYALVYRTYSVDRRR